jgi:predicted TPR repeat methyltransferase
MPSPDPSEDASLRGALAETLVATLADTLVDALADALAAHKAGRFAEAETGYRRVLEARPGHPKALYYLGLLQFHRGDTEGAIELLHGCVRGAPSNGPAWNTLGGLLIAAGRLAEAREAYRCATVAMPGLGEGWYNLGICLRDEGDVEGAVQALRSSVSNQPDYFRAYEALAMLLYQAGHMTEAAQVYGEWARREPQSAKARHMVAATSQQNVPARADDDYVRSLFDESAPTFDASLEKLGYRAPARIADELKRIIAMGSASAAAMSGALADSRLGAVLDAGCGTGLCGPLVRESCTQLVGVDLSPQMIERARARGCYDELVVAELSAFMRSRPQSFDALICADTLVYFGALAEPLAAAHDALGPGGALIFTLEALRFGVSDAGESEAPAAGANVATAHEPEASAAYRLEAHGRYAHTETYVKRAVAAAGFTLDALTHETLREECGSPVRGLVVTARKI